MHSNSHIINAEILPILLYEDKIIIINIMLPYI